MHTYPGVDADSVLAQKAGGLGLHWKVTSEQMRLGMPLNLVKHTLVIMVHNAITTQNKSMH